MRNSTYICLNQLIIVINGQRLHALKIEPWNLNHTILEGAKPFLQHVLFFNCHVRLLESKQFCTKGMIQLQQSSLQPQFSHRPVNPNHYLDYNPI